jgi:type II secretory pathway component PulM
MGKREWTLIIIGGLLLVGILYYFVIVSPAIARQKALVQYISKKEMDLAEMRALKARWENFQSKKRQASKMLNQKKGSFTLLSFLEDVAGKTGIASRIQYLKPLALAEERENLNSEGIEMKLEGIHTGELVSFLLRIENSGRMLNIRKIKIQRTSLATKTLVKVTLQIIAYFPAA